MNEELNKGLCKRLGICWHEPREYHSGYCCSACEEDTQEENVILQHCMESNPDFTSDSGKVRLLREMRKRDDWIKFVSYLVSVSESFFEHLEDDTDKLAIAARDFLKGQKHEHMAHS